MVNKKFLLGIVGLGWWGRKLFKYFSELEKVKIVAVCKKRRIIPEGFDIGEAKLYTDMKEMFEKENMDAVIIATPPTEHFLPTKLAAEKGIHVFCEKPMASSVEDCDKMIEVCNKNNVKLFIAFKHRYAKAYHYLKENAKKFGKPMWAMYIYPLWKIPDPGWKFVENGCKGIIVENVVHAIDNLRYLMGDVKRIYAEGETFIYKNKLPDSTIFTLRFKNGAIAALGGGCTSEERISQERLDIHFEKGIAQVWGFLDYPYKLRVFMREEKILEEHSFEGSDGVREEIQHFFKCIEKDEEPLASGKDGREAVNIALKVIESIRKNKVVELSE